MKTTTISLAAIEYVPDLKRPVFSNRKDYRRYRVALKRMQARIDEQIARTLFGDRYGCEPQPNTYSPTEARRQPIFAINHQP